MGVVEPSRMDTDGYKALEVLKEACVWSILLMALMKPTITQKLLTHLRVSRRRLK